MLPAIVGALAPILGKVIDGAIPDPKVKAELQIELAKLADAGDLREHTEAVAQIEVNKAEASHASMFVAGGRPALIWCGVAALAWEGFIAQGIGLFTTAPRIPADVFDAILMFTAGLCGIRSFDKVKGVARDAIAPPKPGTPVTPDMPVLGQNADKLRRKLKL